MIERCGSGGPFIEGRIGEGREPEEGAAQAITAITEASTAS